MEDDLTPKDENLRLVLSEDHKAWLAAQIAGSKRTIAVLSVIVALGVAGGGWTANYLSGWWASAPQCDYMAPESLQASSNEAGGSAADPCPSGDDGLMALVLAAGFIIFAVIITLVAAIELVRKISKLKEYRNFTGDHREFLSKYNRQ